MNKILSFSAVFILLSIFLILFGSSFKSVSSASTITKKSSQSHILLTPTKIPQIIGPTPVQVDGIYKVYEDGLSSGWENWSWDSNVNFENIKPTYLGNNSISFKANKPWAGLDLHNKKGVSTKGFVRLHFALRAVSDDQKLAVFMDDVNNNHFSSPVPLADYEGDPLNGEWKTYNIPLKDLKTSNSRIYDIVIQSITGKPEPVIYIDELQLR